MFEENYCMGCGRKFTASKSDQMYHSKACRLNYYKPRRRNIKCSECSIRKNCKYGIDFKGKTHPRTCPDVN